ncbi:MAG: PQQ-binding-like beta-propeller repeat protein [Halobacteriaceae archaeon]
MSPLSETPTRRALLAAGGAVGTASLLGLFSGLFDRDAPYATAGATCAAPVSEPAAAGAATWPAAGHDAGATGHNPAVDVTTPPGDAAWTHGYPPSTFPTDAAIGTDRLYVSVADYRASPAETRVEARALADGTRRWTHSLPHRGVWPPTLAPDGADRETLYVASGQDESNTGPGQGVVFALDPASGDVRWREDFDRHLSGPVVAAGGRVFVRVTTYGAAGVHALDATTGDRLWWFPTGDVLHDAPTVADDRLFVNSGRERLAAVNVGDGTLDWESDAPGDSTRPVVDAARGHVLMGHFEGVAAYCAETGERAWHLVLTQTGADDEQMRGVIGEPVVTDDLLYVTTSDTTPGIIGGTTRLRGVAPDTGAIRWTVDDDVGAVVGAGGRALVERESGVQARTAEGAVAWRSSTAWRPVAVGSDFLYADRNNTGANGDAPAIACFPLD